MEQKMDLDGSRKPLTDASRLETLFQKGRTLKGEARQAWIKTLPTKDKVDVLCYMMERLTTKWSAEAKPQPSNSPRYIQSPDQSPEAV